METGNNEIQKVNNDLKLIFYIDNHNFKYSVFNTINNCFEFIKNYPIKNVNNQTQEIEHIIKNDRDLKKKYHTTLVTTDHNTSTFIPDVLFDEKYIEKYIALTSNKKENNISYYSKQKFTDCYSVSSMQDDLMSLLKRDFHNLKIKEVMKRKPISVDKNMLAAQALSLMNEKKITSLCVHESKKKNKTIGFIHIHNILNANIT